MAIEHDEVCPFERPKYGLVRLCGGKSMMLTPRCSVVIDADQAGSVFGTVSRMGNEFVKIEWRTVPVTLYRTGSMLFYHLNDRDTAESYATEILTKLGLVSGRCPNDGKNMLVTDEMK